MVNSLGLPPIQPPVDRGELRGIPGALAVVPEVLLHHSLGEFYLSLKKIAAGFAVTQIALAIARLGDGDAGLLLPVLPWLFLAAAGWHRWGILYRGPGRHVHSYSPGTSHGDRFFTALRQTWAQPPLLLQRCLTDNTLLYLVVQPALVLLLAGSLLISTDVDGGRFLGLAGLAMGWHAFRRQVARRRTIAALRDAPIQQADMAAVGLGARLPQRPHVAQGLQPPRAATVGHPTATVAAPDPLAQLRRMQATVSAAVTSPPVLPEPPESPEGASSPAP